MEIRKDIPEEVKNQMVDGKKRVITVKIPEKFAKKIAVKRELKQKRSVKFFQVSLQVAKGQEIQQSILKDLSSAGESIKRAIEDSFKRLKLKNRKEYAWSFDGKDSFIGVINPKPKEKEEK